MHQTLTVSEIPYPDWPLQTLGISEGRALALLDRESAG